MIFIKRVISYFLRLFKLPTHVEYLYYNSKNPPYDLKNDKVIVGKLFAEFNKTKKINRLKDVEFQVFSQWGDDGIIQFLINNIVIDNNTFIEFGVENYKESNTRFLLINNNWSGLVIDGSNENINFIKNDFVSWAHELHAECDFITKDNINQIITNFLGKGYNENIGVLSVDIDGNDYWIWDEINCVKPNIVIVEYNSLFGSKNPWTIEYQADFYRGNKAQDSFLLYGASLLSLCDLAKEKGYSFVGCNSAGNNAYFVRNDKCLNLNVLSADEGFVNSKFREVRINGQWITGVERNKLLNGKNVYNTRTNVIEKYFLEK